MFLVSMNMIFRMYNKPYVKSLTHLNVWYYIWDDVLQNSKSQYLDQYENAKKSADPSQREIEVVWRGVQIV